VIRKPFGNVLGAQKPSGTNMNNVTPMTWEAAPRAHASHWSHRGETKSKEPYISLPNVLLPCVRQPAVLRMMQSKERERKAIRSSFSFYSLLTHSSVT
jgi:hypothetical protein